MSSDGGDAVPRTMKIGKLYRRATDPEQRQGTKKALLIGINYEKQDGTLRGCHRDALAVRGLLIGKIITVL